MTSTLRHKRSSDLYNIRNRSDNIRNLLEPHEFKQRNYDVSMRLYINI